MHTAKDILTAEPDSSIFSKRKLTRMQQTVLLNLLQKHPDCTSRYLLEMALPLTEERIGITIRHLNRLRVRRWLHYNNA